MHERAVPRTTWEWVDWARETPDSVVFAFAASQRAEVLQALKDITGRPVEEPVSVLGRRVVFGVKFALVPFEPEGKPE